jgi:hypothetical protein
MVVTKIKSGNDFVIKPILYVIAQGRIIKNLNND